MITTSELVFIDGIKMDGGRVFLSARSKRPFVVFLLKHYFAQEYAK